MSKTKKTQKRHPVEDILYAGEYIVWQGKPNASVLEYVAQQTPTSPGGSNPSPSVMEHIFDRVLLYYDKHNRRATLSDNIIAAMSIILSMVTLGLASRWLTVLSSQGIGTLFFLFMFLIVPTIYIALSTMLWLVLQKIWQLFETAILRVIENGNATYIITNRRVIVYTSRWMYRYVFNNSIQHAVIRKSGAGASLTWFEYRNDQPAIPQFVGLSEFDLKHVLTTVDNQINTEFQVTDEREKAKMR